MRVLFCSNELARTGAPLILLDLIRALAGQVEAVVYSPTDGPLRAEFEAAGVPVVNYVAWDFDLLYVNTVLPYRLVLAASRRGLPVVWAVHESDPSLFLDTGQLVAMLKCLPLARTVVFQSHATATVYGRYAPGNNFVVIPGAVDVPAGPVRAAARAALGLSTELAVLTVGTVEKRKGQEDIAAALIHATRPVRWFVVGRRHDPVPADPRMVFAGECQDVWPYYRAADVYACTSRVESYPRAVLEAVGCGLPVVATPVYGLKEQVRGVFYRAGDGLDLWTKVDGRLAAAVEPVPHWPVAEMAAHYVPLLAG